MLISRFSALAALAFVCAAPAIAQQSQGDILLIERVNKPEMATPRRGSSMAQVEQRFGAPLERMDARGGQRRQWPTINRWRYADFIVYFERNRVIDVVAIQSQPGEAGPRPVAGNPSTSPNKPAAPAPMMPAPMMPAPAQPAPSAISHIGPTPPASPASTTIAPVGVPAPASIMAPTPTQPIAPVIVPKEEPAATTTPIP